MPTLGRSIAVTFVALGLLALAAPAQAQTRPPIAEKIAKAQGLDAFGRIEAIRFTFNAQLPGLTLSRSWTWQVKTDQVTYESKDKDGKPVKITYIRSQLDSAPDNVKNEIEPAFVNDEYNLLFPLHVYWDASADVQDMGKQKLPLGKGTAKQVVVKYPSEGGYTQGDTWELYLRRDYRIEQFVYRRGGANPPPPHLVIASWTGYKKAGPLVVSTERSGTADGKPLHVSLTNVAVKMAGSNKWLAAK